MKITHRVPPNWTPPSAELDEAYQREVDLTLLRAARREHQRARGALARMERDARRRDAAATADRLEAARALVAERLAELQAIEALMQQAPTSGRPRVRIVGEKVSKL